MIASRRIRRWLPSHCHVQRPPPRRCRQSGGRRFTIQPLPLRPVPRLTDGVIRHYARQSCRLWLMGWLNNKKMGRHRMVRYDTLMSLTRPRHAYEKVIDALLLRTSGYCWIRCYDTARHVIGARRLPITAAAADSCWPPRPDSHTLRHAILRLQ